MTKHGENGMAYDQAWQKAQDAWKSAGKPIPCYEPKYMAARAVLAAVIKRTWG